MYTSPQCGATSPSLSSLTKSTLEKHLPKLPSKRFFTNQIQKCDVGCITGKHYDKNYFKYQIPLFQKHLKILGQHYL